MVTQHPGRSDEDVARDLIGLREDSEVLLPYLDAARWPFKCAQLALRNADLVSAPTKISTDCAAPNAAILTTGTQTSTPKVSGLSVLSP